MSVEIDPASFSVGPHELTIGVNSTDGQVDFEIIRFNGTSMCIISNNIILCTYAVK